MFRIDNIREIEESTLASLLEDLMDELDDETVDRILEFHNIRELFEVSASSD